MAQLLLSLPTITNGHQVEHGVLAPADNPFEVKAFRQTQRGLQGWEPVVPTLYLPSAQKSATTWLFECMYDAFGPKRLCPTGVGWAKCDKSFFVPTFKRLLKEKKSNVGKKNL